LASHGRAGDSSKPFEIEESQQDMPKLAGSVVKYPARASFVWYFGLIAVGALLLSHPLCRGSGAATISYLDAVFTSTSASCVTGLVVRSTEHDFSWLGQLVILLLIQLGGIGIMTVTTFVMFHLGGRVSLRHRAVLSETLGADARTDLRWILRNVIAFTFLFEGAGFLVLLGRNLLDHPPVTAAWQALFHCVSAFCNAGFALHDDSLVRYQGDPVVNLTICILVVTGGIGFPVILDLWRNRHGRWRERWDRLHLHSKLMLSGTAVLLVLGTCAFLVLESDGVLHGMPYWKRPLVALFFSVTCRTAGFNTVEMASLTNAALFISILLMAIGAGPCSTAGGFKVSTVAVLTLRAWSTFLGRENVSLARRAIPRETVERATATAMLFSVIAVLALTSLLVIEQSRMPHPESEGSFLDASFEVISALGTVGLSTGMTAELSDWGRVIVILLMFIGRLGPISVFIALSRSERKTPLVYPAEEPLIG